MTATSSSLSPFVAQAIRVILLAKFFCLALPMSYRSYPRAVVCWVESSVSSSPRDEAPSGVDAVVGGPDGHVTVVRCPDPDNDDDAPSCLRTCSRACCTKTASSDFWYQTSDQSSGGDEEADASLEPMMACTLSEKLTCLGLGEGAAVEAVVRVE